MRDFIVLAIILGSAPIALLYPYFGVLMWTWVAYFNPHRFAWGIAYDFPVAAVLAVPTLVGTLFTKQTNKRIFTKETILLLLLWAWFGVTLFHASMVPLLSMHVPDGRTQLLVISKILLMTMVTLVLTNSPRRLRLLFLVTALSFGFLAIKGAVFGLRSAGEFRVWGPPESFIADNNDFGLALNIVLPMMFFLCREEQNKMMRVLLRICFFASVLCVILTYSRGALLGLATVMAAIVIKTRHRLAGAVGVLVLGILVFSYAPEKWQTRMDALLGGKLDQSAEQRLVSWEFALNVASAYPITGGSLQCFTPEMFERYSKEPVPGGGLSSGPHSIYFQMIGEQGYIGLALFLALISSCYFTLRGIRQKARLLPSARWMIAYSDMIEAGLWAFLASGAFLGRAYFDLFYQLIASAIILKLLYRRELLLAAESAVTARAMPQEEELPEFAVT